MLLDHPILQSDQQKLNAPGQYYHNPHNPPPGGFARANSNVVGRPGYPGVVGNASRWNSNVSGKSVEIQRSQVDELFKSLRDGDELAEAVPRMFVSRPVVALSFSALSFFLNPTTIGFFGHYSGYGAY